MSVFILFWLEVSVDDAEAVKVIEGQRQLSQIELHIFFSEHHLRERERERPATVTGDTIKVKPLLLLEELTVIGSGGRAASPPWRDV